MFITKKHISRRTVLRGAGAALALPFLESMIPAGMAQSSTAAAAAAAVRRPLHAAWHGSRVVGSQQGRDGL